VKGKYMLSITEENVGDFIGRRVRAIRNSEVMEGVIRGRSNMVVSTADGPVHPIELDTGMEIEIFVPSDGWKLTEL
jgi:hypothetical protein